MRLDDRVCSGWFAVEQVLRQGCVLAPLPFNIFFAAVINVASTRFKADKGTMDALVHLRKKRTVGGRGEATVGESVLTTPLYADDTRGRLAITRAAKEDDRGVRGRVRGVVHRHIQRRGSGPGV